MNRQSLGLRLMGLAASMVVFSLVFAGFILHALFVSNLERSVQGDLEAALTRIVALIDPAAAQPSIRLPLPDPRYDTPLGGRYWQIEDTDSGAIARSRSLFDQELGGEPVSETGTFHFSNDSNLHLIMIRRPIEVGNRHFEVTVGENHEPIHEAGMRFAWDIARLFSLLGLVILGIAWVQLRLGLRPLDRLRSSVDEVRRGDVDALTGAFPSEIQPLVDEVNALLAERQSLAERGRRRAADLAHGLKTPLAALHGVAMRLRDRGDEDDAVVLDDLAQEMSSRVDYQMRLAALRSRSREHRESSSLNTAVLRTMTVLRKTGRGEMLHWKAELGEEVNVDIHRQDLLELIGVTLENGAKWARTTVAVQSSKQDGMALITVGDDGPGIEPEHMQKLGSRGLRHDESVPGTGLGLAIAKEILELNRGTIGYAVAPLGGLLVEIRLPLALS
ncbi:sensor histidine kinase [Devosia rhizoryzae]|uniref:histidine kinase n=1 Tax=Devosia rhizoryzae TaxID=2774137 RepID=A0ABX7C9R1_9HYPH|nr:HAMP domain-containing sensor histidine kinase [Devosia rhizoryzae]QQR40004.1 HAMP domain-containing histidine kinase [Devosia rhizoryzae]